MLKLFCIREKVEYELLVLCESENEAMELINYGKMEQIIRRKIGVQRGVEKTVDLAICPANS